MDVIVQMLSRLQGVSGAIQATIGDSFNLQMMTALAQQLTAVEKYSFLNAQVQEAQAYSQFIPVNTNIPGATISSANTLMFMKGVGLGKDYDGTSNDIPLAEVIAGKETIGVAVGTIGYQYSIHELADAAKYGIPLDVEKAQAATFGAEAHLSNVAWYGSPKTGAKGFINQTVVEIIPASTDWKTATADEIVADFNMFLKAAYNNSEYELGVAPDTIVIAASIWELLSNRRLHEYTDKTLLKHLQENNILAQNGRTLTWRSSSKFDGKGAGGTHRMVLYRRDPSCLEFRLPQDITFLAAQAQGLIVRIPGHYMYQGVHVKRPDSIKYMDVGITP